MVLAFQTVAYGFEETPENKEACAIVFKQIELEKLKVRVKPHGESHSDYFHALQRREEIIKDFLSDPSLLPDSLLQEEVQRIMNFYNSREDLNGEPQNTLPGLFPGNNVYLVSELIEDFHARIHNKPMLGRLHNFITNVGQVTVFNKWVVEEDQDPLVYKDAYERWSEHIYELSILNELHRRLATPYMLPK